MNTTGNLSKRTSLLTFISSESPPAVSTLGLQCELCWDLAMATTSSSCNAGNAINNCISVSNTLCSVLLINSLSSSKRGQECLKTSKRPSTLAIVLSDQITITCIRSQRNEPRSCSASDVSLGSLRASNKIRLQLGRCSAT